LFINIKFAIPPDQKLICISESTPDSHQTLPISD
jgi:hypothetical protein